jgi:putative exporter of polyketide antibiotics
MKKMQFLLTLVVAMLAMVAGCAPGTIAQVNTPDSNAEAGTPTSSGQINVPGVSIQLYTPGPNPLVGTADANGQIASIGLGIWHGIISPVTMVLSFVNQGGEMYEVHNDGSQYNLGFLVGVAIVFVLLGVTAGSRRRR